MGVWRAVVVGRGVVVHRRLVWARGRHPKRHVRRVRLGRAVAAAKMRVRRRRPARQVGAHVGLVVHAAIVRVRVVKRLVAVAGVAVRTATGAAVHVIGVLRGLVWRGVAVVTVMATTTAAAAATTTAAIGHS
jgi:hypothetical protein